MTKCRVCLCCSCKRRRKGQTPVIQYLVLINYESVSYFLLWRVTKNQGRPEDADQEVKSQLDQCFQQFLRPSVQTTISLEPNSGSCFQKSPGTQQKSCVSDMISVPHVGCTPKDERKLSKSQFRPKMSWKPDSSHPMKHHFKSNPIFCSRI